ncbi:hypothetical protein Tco_1058902, partial [Tanacetum coccineum]
EEPSGDDVDDEDEDEEEEHPAPADSVPPVHCMTARISIQDKPSISLPPREGVERLLALTTPPPSLLTPLSSLLPQIPSPPILASPPASVFPASPPASPIRPLGYRAAMIRLRVEAASTSHSLPLLPLNLLSTDRREGRPEVCLPPRKRLCSTQDLRYDIGESSSAVAARPTRCRRADYGFVGTMDIEIRRQRAEEVGYGYGIREVGVDTGERLDRKRDPDISSVEGTLVDVCQYHYEIARTTRSGGSGFPGGMGTLHREDCLQADHRRQARDAEQYKHFEPYLTVSIYKDRCQHTGTAGGPSGGPA